MTGVRLVQLGGRRGEVTGYALVDAEDFERVSAYKWHTKNNHPCRPYAQRRLSGSRSNQGPFIGLQHEVLQVSRTTLIDHINRDALDNRKVNLRAATISQNAANRAISHRNTSGFKGVFWSARRSAWEASITYQGQHITIGQFKCVDTAAQAYDAAARKFFGEFARLNFPTTGENGARQTLEVSRSPS